jgi:Zn-finger nucleic acid-binding protein
MESLTCPKCHGAMRTYERSGVTIDQCTDCRGIFLDRGELERLIDADAKFHAETAAPPPAAPAAPAGPPPPQPQQGYYHDYDDSPDKRRGGYQYGYGKPRKKRRSIFEDLFD